MKSERQARRQNMDSLAGYKAPWEATQRMIRVAVWTMAYRGQEQERRVSLGGYCGITGER